MIYLKTDEEIELMRSANQLVGRTLGELAKHIAPGVTTLQLDKIAILRIEQRIPNNDPDILPAINKQVLNDIPCRAVPDYTHLILFSIS